MLVSVKEIMVDLKWFNGTCYISDPDVNRIMYPKQKHKSRGKQMSKDKIVDMDVNSVLKISNQMYFPLLIDIDDCYYNNEMLVK